MYISNEDEITFRDLLRIGDGSDYERGQIETLSASIDIIRRITIFSALKSGVTIQELIKLHNDSGFEEMVRESFPNIPEYKPKDFPKPLPGMWKSHQPSEAEIQVQKDLQIALSLSKEEYINSQIAAVEAKSGPIPPEVRATMFRDLNHLFVSSYIFKLEPAPTPENPYMYKVSWIPKHG